MVTYEWKILRLDCYQSLTDESGNVFNDVIYALQWQLTGIDEFANSAWIYDSLGIDIQLAPNYIPRTEITDEILINWTVKKLGDEKIAELKQQIDNQIATISGANK